MPNNDYILRSDAISAFCGNCEATEICRQLGEPCEEVKQIKAIPAADVEPVIHCKDCIHGFSEIGQEPDVHCSWWDYPMPPAGFCFNGFRAKDVYAWAQKPEPPKEEDDG